jgi:ribose transport system ATP-binding protein
MEAPALRIEHLSKCFDGVPVLSDVSLEVAAGEVHGLLGENGSGKSTLIKILAGFHTPEPGGRLWVGGIEATLPLTPGAFRRLGLSFVHQDLALIASLTAAENLFIDELVSRWSWRWSWRQRCRRAAGVFSAYGVEIDPTRPVGELSRLEQAMLAIVRAIEQPAAGRVAQRRLLVLDEPTVFLPSSGIDQLFALIQSTVMRGASVLFVSHDLDEVREITDRVTVLRDGRVQGTIATQSATKRKLVEMIIGRDLVQSNAVHIPSRTGSAISFKLRAHDLDPLELDIRRGEIVGLTGLVGSGFERIPYLAFGADAVTDGALTIDGRNVRLASLTPGRALEHGVVLLPADRQRDGSVAELSIAENVMLPVLARYRRGLRLQRRALVRDAHELLARFDVRPNQPHAAYGTLSGGNQQKALLAKWLQLEPKLLLLDEPTQGVDVAAREQIFSIIGAVAANGAAVICASSDHDQLARLCDRVLIVARGRISAELAGGNVSKEAITKATFKASSSPASGPTDDVAGRSE